MGEVLTDFEKQLKQKTLDSYAGTIGHTLQKAYPKVDWMVDVDLQRNGGMACIRAWRISKKYGMWIKLTSSDHLLQQETLQAGGELLERFGVSRTFHADRDVMNLPKDITGEALGASKGEKQT